MSENKEIEEDQAVSLLDALKMQKDLEDEYAAVYGASDEKLCTYSMGYVKRQALYACLTCCPDAQTDKTKCAGICLACSNKCHENHELIELYTKRNFRCDCPTETIPGVKCHLNSSYDMDIDGKKLLKNTDNLYNHNFWGLYCICERPYPDPDNSNEDEMLQCEICEDWYHKRHLNASLDMSSSENDYELVCGKCMTSHKFLQDYAKLAFNSLNVTIGSEQDNINCEDDEISVCDDKLKSDLDKSISEIMNINSMEQNETENLDENHLKLKEKEKEVETVAEVVAEAEEFKKAKRPSDNEDKSIASNSKRLKLDNDEKTKTVSTNECCRPTTQSLWKEGESILFPSDWRSTLCKCTECISMYETEKIAFLLDSEDSVKIYEEKGINRLAALETKAFEQCAQAFSSIGRAQQIDAILEYNRFKEKLTEFLRSFVAANKVITEADVDKFFQEMRKTRNSNIGQPYFCR